MPIKLAIEIPQNRKNLIVDKKRTENTYQSTKTNYDKRFKKNW